MDEYRGQNRDADRRKFLAALGLFLLWVSALGAMAVLSGRPPAPNPTTLEDH